jgi:hypothetical protein
MSRKPIAVLMLALALCAAFACGRKAKPEPLRGESPIRNLSSSAR